DNVIRAVPLLVEEVKKLKNMDKIQLQQIISSYNNLEVLRETLNYIFDRLKSLAENNLRQLVKEVGV
ncbi:MAG TPA: DUF137 domain-containing protein, partial [Pyrodictium sp.]|nr:DUF137 domain-containing protein [Pyrodictium sp.]